MDNSGVAPGVRGPEAARGSRVERSQARRSLAARQMSRVTVRALHRTRVTVPKDVCSCIFISAVFNRKT